MQPDFENLIQPLSLRWKTPFLFCPLNFSSIFAANTSGFKVSCLLHQIDLEISLAQQDLALIRSETTMFLTPPQPPRSTHQRRGGSVGPAALATVRIFGWGLAIGASDSCGLRGIFGNCESQSKAKDEKVRHLADFQKSLTNYVTGIITSKAEKLLVVVGGPQFNSIGIGLDS